MAPIRPVNFDELWPLRSAGGGSNDQELPAELEDAVASYIDRLNQGEKLTAALILEEQPQKGEEILKHLRTFLDLGAEIDSRSRLGQLGDYQLIRQIGRGGMGVVYEAWQNSMNRQVALKVLPAGLAADYKTCTRFMREARLAGQLNHQNIVSVHAMGVAAETPYYAMEYVEGETLAQLLARLTLADLEARFAYNMAEAFAGVAEGLEHAHKKGIIHRDIKPSNLIIDRQNHLRILDFGLARLEGQESLTLSGDLLGTPSYMSPEQAKARQAVIDHRTDIYSLGATLYQTLAQRPPFKGRDYQETLSQIIAKEPEPPHRFNARIPKDLETIILKCLRKGPADRYRTAEALAQDLRRFVRGDPIEARPQTGWEKLVYRVERRWRTLAVGAAILLLSSFGAWATFNAWRSNRLYRETQSIQLVDLAQNILNGQAISAESLPGSVPPELPEALKAVQCLEKALAFLPENGPAYFWRGNAYFEAGELEAATRDYSEAIRRGVETGPAYYRRGMAWECLGQSEAAHADIIKAQEIAPEDGLLLFYQGVAAQADGQIAPAIDRLKHSFRKRPSVKPFALCRLALCYYSLGDLDQAVSYLRTSISLRSQWLNPVVLLAQIGLQKRDPAIVEEVLELLRSDFPQSRDILALAAFCRYFGDFDNRLDTEAAAGDMLQTLTGWSKVKMQYWRWTRRGEAGKAEALLLDHVKQSPEEFEPWLWLGQHFFEERRYEESLTALQKAERLSKPYRRVIKWQILWLIGQTMARLERWPEAAQKLEEALVVRRIALANHLLLNPFDNFIFRIQPESRSFEFLPPEYFNPRILLGSIYRQLDRLEDAEKTLGIALEEHPRSCEAHFELGLTLKERGRIELALRHLERADGLGKEGRALAISLAWLYCKTGRFPEAQKKLQQLTRSAAKSEAWFGLAMLHKSLRQSAEARSACDRGLEGGQYPECFHLLKGQIHKQSGDFTEARREFEWVERQAPGWAWGHWELGRLAMETGDFLAAEAFILKALDGQYDFPAADDWLIQLGEPLTPTEVQHKLFLCLLAQDRFDEARSRGGKIFQLEAESLEVTGKMISGLAEIGRTGAALALAKEASEKWPREPAAWMALGKVSGSQEAVAALERALQLDPQIKEGYFALSQAWTEAGKFSEGEACLKKGMERFPEDPLFKRQLVNFYHGRKRFRQVIELIRSLNRDEGERRDLQVQNFLVWSLLNVSDGTAEERREAVELARRMAEEEPGNPYYLNTCGLALLRTGKASEALEFFHRAQALLLSWGDELGQGENLFHFSMAYTALGRDLEARTAFEEGKKLAPESDIAEEARQQLR